MNVHAIKVCILTIPKCVFCFTFVRRFPPITSCAAMTNLFNF